MASDHYKYGKFWGDNHRALIALCAALFAIVAWAVLAWYFGIPTSESHALIAGLSGAAIAMRAAFGASMAVNGSRSSTDWDFLRFWGLFLGFLSASWYPFCAGDSTGEGQTVFKGSSDRGATAMAFMHGASGWAEVSGVLLLGICLSGGNDNAAGIRLPVWMMLLCSL